MSRVRSTDLADVANLQPVLSAPHAQDHAVERSR